MKLAHFALRSVGTSGVDQKIRGCSSDRGTEATIFTLSPGKRRILRGASHLRVVFVMKGRRKSGRKEYKRPTAIEFPAGDVAGFTADTTTELLCMTIPSVDSPGLSAA